MMRILLLAVLFPALALADARVSLYTSVDEPYARPIVRAFEEKTGIKVDLRTDAEAGKSVGLAERIRAEKDNPQADVLWGNEVFHTIRLADDNLLEAYDSPAGKDVPALFRDKQNRWIGMGLRVRVIAVAADAPFPVKALSDLLDPRLRGRITLARPTAGTTGGHVAALYVLWGDEKAGAYFKALRANGARMVGGNAIVADQVGQGRFLAGLTDNDDVAASQKSGGKLSSADADADGAGTLAIPCTVALIRNAKNPGPAKQLIDYLLSPDAEKHLLETKFAQYSVRDGQLKDGPRFMPVDYAEVAKKLPEAVRDSLKHLEGR